MEADPPRDVGLTLVDPNPDVLEHCAVTLAAWSPSLVEANVLEPLPVVGPFDSAALSQVLHCLPGPMEEKARAIEHVAAVLADDGVLFGGTVLGLSADHTTASFEDVEITMPSGSVAYFVASGPRRADAAELTPG